MESVQDFRNKSQKTIDFLREDLKTIRTGRASASLIDKISVEAYQGSAVLKITELATVTTNGPSALVISPFDPATISDIEKAIIKSPLGLSPIVQNSKIIIKIPSLSQEQREKYVKLVNAKTEEKRNQIRKHRDDARKIFKESFEKKEIGEDEKYRLEKEVDNLSSVFMEEISKIKQVKEKDIMDL